MYLSSFEYKRTEKNKAFLSFYSIALLIWTLILPATVICSGKYYSTAIGETVTRNFDGYNFIMELFSNFTFDALLSLKCITMIFLACSLLACVFSIFAWTLDMKEKIMNIGCIFLFIGNICYLIESIFQYNDFNYYLANLGRTYSAHLLAIVYFGVSIISLIIYLIMKKKMELI